MTAVIKEDPRLHTLRLLLRGLLAFRVFNSSDSLDEVTDREGRKWSLYDIERVYAFAMRTPSGVGPFVALAQEIQPGWLVQHSNVWTSVYAVDQHADRREVLITLLDGETKRKRRDMPVRCLTEWRQDRMAQDREAPFLPLRQRQAIELYIVQNLAEKDVVSMIGINPTMRNAVRSYASAGLVKLLGWMDEGLLVSPFDDAPLARAS